jgi:hypothetical protein
MKKHIATLFLFVLCACELIVDIDVPFEHAQLTVNSFFNPDSVWRATVSINRHILDDTPLTKIGNADLIIYADDLPIDTLVHEYEGNYRSDEKPLIGKRYEIRVSATDYEPVSAHSEIPLPAGITSFTLNSVITDNRNDVTIRIKFNDDGAHKNYYRISLDAEHKYIDPNTGETNYSRHPVFLETDNPENTPYNQYLQIDNSIFVKDILFSGKEADISIKSQDFSAVYADRVIVTLRTLTEEYYNYVTTSELQDVTSGDPFAQPVNVYNNIEHGFGIFAGYSQSTFTHENPVPVIKEITPMQGSVGDLITISGENFGDDIQYMRVGFAGTDYPVYAPVIEKNGDQLSVAVPQGAITGKITFYSRGQSAISDVDFEVIQ